MALLDIANGYLHAGLCVLPAIQRQKRPAVAKWQPFQSRLPTDAELERWFKDADSLCLICGAVSGNLEIIDFDLGGEAFEAWCDRVAETDRQLLDRLVMEQSPSGGWHVVYRCETAVCGNLKLAQRKHLVDSNDETNVGGKAYRPRQDADGNWHVILTSIETRGEGGLFLCAPSPGYTLVQGDFPDLPVLTTAERDVLLQAAWSLNDYMAPSVAQVVTGGPPVDGRPGDDFNERGNVRDVLRRHGWTLTRGGENEYWRRPGKTSGWSATLKNSVFFVFSANAEPFEPQRAYSPFSVYTVLEHGGDYEFAARSLRLDGYGDASHGIAATVQLIEPSEPPDTGLADPGPLPNKLLRVPGFISAVMDHCLETAPYPNKAIAFCGALALQSFLAGRKVRDPGDNRTNLYLLGLAHSSAGKDWPRKINVRILHEIGLAECIGERFASGEGIQDSLFVHPNTLFQTDEIDSILQSVNKARDARHEAIMSTLLTLYSSANSVLPMRRKAGKELSGVIDQPHLTIFGTAIPNHYYEALSERMLTNGFFARMLILECGARGKGQEPKIQDLPEYVLAVARWWAEFQPGSGNLESFHPVPIIVPHTTAARSVLIEAREEAESEYANAENRNDPVGTTVWGRASEQARKLALIYAVSENHINPKIGRDAVEWAVQFVMHQTRRMLFMADGYVARTDFDAMCKEMLRALREWKKKRGDEPMPEWQLNRRLPWKPRDHEDVRITLSNQKRIHYEVVPTKTQPRKLYHLLED